MSTFGKTLRRIREALGKNMGEVAKYMGWTIAYQSDIELSRKKPPKAEHMEKMVMFLQPTKEQEELLLDLAAIERKKWTFLMMGRAQEEQRFVSSLARLWESGEEITKEKMQEILDESFDGQQE